jgi:hypothetical protein
MTFKPETQLLNLQSFYLEYKILKKIKNRSNILDEKVSFTR